MEVKLLLVGAIVGSLVLSTAVNCRPAKEQRVSSEQNGMPDVDESPLAKRASLLHVRSLAKTINPVITQTNRGRRDLCDIACEECAQLGMSCHYCRTCRN
jgi:hypothetical protein